MLKVLNHLGDGGRRFRNIAWAALGLGIALPNWSAAQVTGPVFPPQGNVTFVASGVNGQVAGETTGRTFFYSNFNETNLSALYWTFYSIENPRLLSQASTGQMTFSGYNPLTGIATWSSSANLVWNTATGTQSIPTQFVMQLQPFTGVSTGQLGSGWLTPTTASAAGIGSLPSSHSVLNVLSLPNPDNYQVWFRYQTTSGIPLLDYYDSTNSTSGSTAFSASGGFYQTVVPEPNAVALLAISGGALGLIRRRRS